MTIVVGAGWWPCCLGDPRNPPPAERMSRTRAGEGHLSVRFGDLGPRYAVLLDGEDVTSRCVEVVAGGDGWAELERHGPSGAVLHPSPCHHQPGCTCGVHVATELRRGHVQVTRR